MALPVALVLLQSAGDYADAARVRTSAVVRCIAESGASDVTVCGLRRADRYRVPLVTHDPGDRRYESVAEERARLIHRTTAMDDRGPFLVGGGMAGVSMTVGAAGGVVVEGERPLAP